MSATVPSAPGRSRRSCSRVHRPAPRSRRLPGAARCARPRRSGTDKDHWRCRLRRCPAAGTESAHQAPPQPTLRTRPTCRRLREVRQAGRGPARLLIQAPRRRRERYVGLLTPPLTPNTPAPRSCSRPARAARRRAVRRALIPYRLAPCGNQRVETREADSPSDACSTYREIIGTAGVSYHMGGARRLGFRRPVSPARQSRPSCSGRSGRHVRVCPPASRSPHSGRAAHGSGWLERMSAAGGSPLGLTSPRCRPPRACAATRGRRRGGGRTRRPGNP